jgi:prepilin-type N-terminal cleavage/methylation domain-containing protein
MIRARGKNFAFTLMELVLVMVIIAIALAAAAQALSGWSRGTKLRDAGDQFLAMTRYARTRAVADARVYRMNVDSAQASYWITVQDGANFSNLGSDFGRVFVLPDGFAIEMRDEQGAPMQFVEFYPTGRTLAANVRIRANEKDVIEIASPSPAEGFALVADRGPQ